MSMSGCASHWRGHLLLFDARVRPSYPDSAGLRLIVGFVLLEVVVGPRFHLLTLLDLPQPAAWIRVVALLVLALVLVRLVAGLPLAAVGLIQWRDWSTTEKSYFVQVLVIANVVFALIYEGRVAQAPGAWAAAAATGFAWGFYQEVVYRGILQTELTRRFGAIVGVLAANILFTFGPLHYYYFATSPLPIAMLAGIFAIGLYFAALRHRSGNLWLPAVFHGIGAAWVLGAAGT